MAQAGNHDHAPCRCLFEPFQQPVDQHEVSEMIRHKLELEPIFLLEYRWPHDARITNQHIDRPAQRLHLFGTGDYRIKITEFASNRGDLQSDFSSGILSLFPGSRRADNMGAALRQHTHGFKAEAGITARNQYRFTPQINIGGDFFGR